MYRLWKYIASNEIIGWPAADQAVVSGGNFCVALLLARYIGIEQYGIFVLTWMVVLFFSSIHQAAVISPMQTILPKLKGNVKVNLFHSLIINVIFIAFSGFVVIIGVLLNEAFSWFTAIDHSYELIAVLSTFLLYDYLRKSFYVSDKTQWSFILSLISYGLLLTCFIIMGEVGILNLSNAFMIMSSAFAISSVLGFYKVDVCRFSWNKTKTLLKDYNQFSKWLTLTSLLQWFNNHVFVISSGAILGPAAAGGIRICQNIVGVLHIVFISIENVIPIKAAKTLSAEGLQAMLVYLNKFTLKFGMAVLAMLVIVSIYAENILTLAYGEQYAQYTNLLRGFSFLYLLVFLVIPLKIALRTIERTRILFFVYVASAVLGALISTTFILKWHYTGVILGLITVQSVVLIGYIFSIRKEIKNYANHSFSIR